MTLEQLEARYGKLMIQAEILQAQIQETKKLLVDEINKQNKPNKEVS